MNALKEKLKNREKVCGSHILMNDFIASDIVSSLGYDFIWVDTEHSCIDYATLLNHIAIIKNKGGHVLVRVHMDDNNHTKRVLEMGPDGVIFPMINTREEAEKAIASTFYPPKGIRGYGPLRASDWGGEPLAEYRKKEEDFVRCIQIETRQAVENIEDIVKVKEIDCYIIGPCDLSISINKFAQVFDEENIALIKRVIEVVHANGKAVGVSYGGTMDEAALQRWADLGMDFISSGSDYEAIRYTAVEQLKILKRVMKK